MKVVAFYSYKGGTGRTLTLANVAALATLLGKNVFVLDMDLEAPGTTYKFRISDDVRSRGFVGYMLDTVTMGQQPVSLDDYVLEVAISDEFVGFSRSPGGRLRIMPAGSIPSPNYFAELRQLSFDQRAADGSALSLVQALLDSIKRSYRPDLLLIDARTGITNSNTLVLAELADDVYALALDLPEQLDGTRMVLRSLTQLTKPTDGDRPVRLQAILSRVPTHSDSVGWTQSEEDKARLEKLRRFISEPANPLEYTVSGDIKVSLLHHHPPLVNEERLLLTQLSHPSVSSAALTWDLANLAMQVIGDEEATASIVEALLAADDRPNAQAIFAVLQGDAQLRAPGASRPGGHDGDPPLDAPLIKRIDSVRRRASADPGLTTELVDLLIQQATRELEIGHVDSAQNVALEAVEHAERLPAGIEYTNIRARARDTLGRVLGALGDIGSGIAMWENAISEYEPLLGAGDPITLAARNNLGYALKEAGDLDRAITVLEQTLRIRQSHLGDSAAETMVTRDNLAASYLNQGDLPRAIALYEQTLAFRERDLGPAHPLTLASLGNVGGAYVLLGKIEQSIPLFRRALFGWEQTAGADDPRTTQARRDLAGALAATGDFEGSSSLYEQSLADLERNEPVGSEEVFQLRNTVADFYERFNEPRRAAPLYEASLRERSSAETEGSEEIIGINNNLALALLASGEAARARTILKRNLEVAERSLGATHLLTLAVRNNLASADQAEGRLEAAIKRFEETLQDLENAVGRVNPNTFMTRHNLAHAYRQSGRLSQAIRTYTELVSDMEAVGDEPGVDLIVARENLAGALHQAGHFHRAADVLRTGLGEAERVFGFGHSQTVMLLARLAESLASGGDHAEAAARFEEAEHRVRQMPGASDGAPEYFHNRAREALRNAGNEMPATES